MPSRIPRVAGVLFCVSLAAAAVAVGQAAPEDGPPAVETGPATSVTTSVTTVATISPAARPASGASTRPASRPYRFRGGDMRAGLKAYNAAMMRDDVPGMLACEMWHDNDERRVAEAFAEGDAAVGRLLNAVRAKFGDDAAAKVGAAMGDQSDAMIEGAAEDARNGKGRIVPKGGGPGTPMIYFRGAWKIDIRAAVTRDGGQVDPIIDAAVRHGSPAKVITQEVAAGEFDSVDAVLKRVARAIDRDD